MAITGRSEPARVVSGTATGTGAAINVVCGFIPLSVKVWNLTNVECHIWNDAMTDAYSLKLANTCGVLTSAGISPYTGGSPTVSLGTTAGNSQGFTIGATISINTNVLYYEAIG